MHEAYMRRCFELALLGKGMVAPNPLVGSVVVHNDRIIGEGYHQQYGGPHAEVNAIAAVKDASLFSEATLYVNLEPCAHHGKTPPCADLIIEMGIPKVVIANLDPHELVAGKGIEKLRSAGVEVVTGALEAEGRKINKRFFTFHEQKRPYIILKFAQTQDGYLDAIRPSREAGEPLAITSAEANALVHRWRAEEQSILVGLNTVQLDDPSLTTRHWPGKNPIRMVIDPQLQINPAATMLTDGLPTWVFNAVRSDVCEDRVCYVQIDDPASFEQEIMAYLHKNDIQSLIIEGGATTLRRFISADLWDEARIFTGPMRIGSGIPSPELKGVLLYQTQLGRDQLHVYKKG